MPATSLAYRALARAAVALAPLAARRMPKLAAALAGRRGAVDRLAAWARGQRDPIRPLLWMHAPSVGEGLQAEAVLRLVRDAHPEWQIVYTHFSPSATELAARQPADVAEYLPWDRRVEVDSVLQALRPKALVFAKLDLWPELATRAAAGGAAVGLIAATVSPLSGRLRWPSRALLRPGYAAVTRAGAVSEQDAARLARLGLARERIEITGDPRFDSAWVRARAAAADPLRRFGGGAPTLVAGSTWPADEAVIFDAFARVRTAHPDARLLLVPHEPTAEHLAATEDAARRRGLPPPVRLSRADGPAAILLVDRVGILAALYHAGDVAYVGGGFGTAGLHSVLEPAACGLPVLIGPRWEASREAGLLRDAGAALVVEDGAALAGRWLAWLGDPGARTAAGVRARETIEAGLGAAARSADLVSRLMAPGAVTVR